MGRLLSSAERDVFHGWALARRRDDWLGGRLAVKLLVRRMLAHGGARPLPLDAIEVLADDAGAPRLSFPGDTGRFRVSIAHDNGFAVAALADARLVTSVGVDLERRRRLSLGKLHHVLTRNEQIRLRASTSGPDRIAIWALKEAVVKAVAGGAAMSLRDIDVDWDARGVVAVHLPPDTVPQVTAGWRCVGANVVAWAACRRTS